MPPSSRPALRLVASEPPTGSSVLERARGGDERALRALYETHVDYVTGLCVRLLRSRDRGQDAAQDAFTTAFEKLPQLREDYSFRAWVAQIAVHACHGQMRRAKWISLFGLLGEEAPTPLDQLADSGVPPHVLYDLRLADVALRSVPPPERIAWSLRHLEGEKLEDIALACDCSLATAKRRILSAERILLAELGETP